MGGFSLWHLLISRCLVLLLFGGNRFSDMMGDVAKGLKSFKQGMADEDDDKRRARRAAPRRAAAPAADRTDRRHARAGRADPRRSAAADDDRRPLSQAAPMFGVDSSELLIVAVLALMFIGPKDLPQVMRTVGHWVGQMRGMARHFTSGIENVIREAELEEMEKKWREENERIMRAASRRRAIIPSRARRTTMPPADDAEPDLPLEAPPRRRRSDAADRAAAAVKDIDESKAPLLDHLIELRRRLLWCVATLVARLLRLPLLRPADLRGPGPAAARGGAGQAHLHRHFRSLLRRGEGRLLRRADDQLPGDRDADLAVRRAGPLRQGEEGVPAVPADDARSSSPAGAALRLFRRHAVGAAFPARATRAMSAASSRRRCPASAII